MNESTYTILFLDTETTGNTKEDRICQLSFKRSGESTESMFDEVFKTPLPIAIEAMAIHHITNEMLEGKPLFAESPHFNKLKELLEDEHTIIVAHNARFDIDMIKKEGINPAHFIDTLKITRALDPNGLLPRHNLQYLRYKLGLYKLITEKISPHDAKSDVIVLELLFNRVFDKMLNITATKNIDDALTEMMRISSEPTLIKKISFGKYKDSIISELATTDRGYLEWLLKEKKKTPDEEEDWIYTLVYHLEGKDKADQQFNISAQPLFTTTYSTKTEAPKTTVKANTQGLTLDQFIDPIVGLMPSHDEINIDDDIPDFDEDDEDGDVAYDEYADKEKLETIEF